MRCSRIAASGLALALLCSSALAEKHTEPLWDVVTIHDDWGGATDLYEHRAEHMRGRTLKLVGVCASACTIYLWRRYGVHVCAGPVAELWFHKPLWLNADRHPIVSPELAQEADRLWQTEDMVELPRNITAVLAHEHVPSPSAGEPWGNAVKLHARDFLSPC